MSKCLIRSAVIFHFIVDFLTCMYTEAPPKQTSRTDEQVRFRGNSGMIYFTKKNVQNGCLFY